MNAGKDIAGIVGSIFFFFVGAAVFAMSFEMTPMAAMFPRTVGAALALLAAFYIFAAMRGYRGEAVENGSTVREQAEGLGRRIVLLMTMIGWALLFPVMGMFVTSLAACVLLMFTGLFERIPPGRLALQLGAVLALVVCFYFLMSNILNIPMPRGIFF
ncbi:tripartite tricarboxylate transporter TctB family protein [uncultured Nitratireductor sp.]|uniref:tripartite tricarboxylate transporter TctB family protein n=1 Tax=uncultured Nitratireductor sp. TaxID=520953 RepID=UPI0025EE19B0|nr:tripartite tricarboxylate transporter TctB family protein [uncultured Nitratireductor sp.]